MGEKAVSLLVERIAAPDTPPRHILLPPDLAALQHSRRTHWPTGVSRPRGALSRAGTTIASTRRPRRPPFPRPSPAPAVD
ncbi:hypothetical protein ABT150_07970 [Streptomyces mirabilis]|uniref:hypothetical protein n=1 Tax=Streptomyces mirabilis TaxID=68239 RepID=UPI00331AE7B6